MSDRVSKVRPYEIPTAGVAHGSTPPEGALVQRAGSRETFTFHRNRWVSQNDDLGGKLDRLAAGQDALLNKLDETNELLVGIVAALTGSST